PPRSSAFPYTTLFRSKRRGLFDSTLVIWGGEFGRMPVSQGANGRDHNPRGFLLWMTGAGIRGGASHGETDEIGYRAAVDPVTVRSEEHTSELQSRFDL